MFLFGKCTYLGTNITDRKEFYDKISKMNFIHAVDFSVQKTLSIKMYKRSYNLLYGYERRSLTLRKAHKLQAKVKVESKVVPVL
jgi:hypothetical protein